MRDFGEVGVGTQGTSSDLQVVVQALQWLSQQALLIALLSQTYNRFAANQTSCSCCGGIRCNAEDNHSFPSNQLSVIVVGDRNVTGRLLPNDF
jgi:hypothetical protein